MITKKQLRQQLADETYWHDWCRKQMQDYWENMHAWRDRAVAAEARLMEMGAYDADRWQVVEPSEGRGRVPQFPEEGCEETKGQSRYAGS